jgi:phosphatidyl-myo-inositol alpha-mannosyltransferase
MQKDGRNMEETNGVLPDLLGGRPRIAFCCNDLPSRQGKKGGVAASVDRLAETLTRRNNVDLTFFSTASPPVESRYKFKKLFTLMKGSRFSQWILSPIALNFQDFSDYDIVHLHGDDWFFFNPQKIIDVRTFYGSSLDEARVAKTVKRRIAMYLCGFLEYFSSFIRNCKIGLIEETKKQFNCNYVVGCGVEIGIFTPTRKTDHPSISYIGQFGTRKRGEFIFDIFINEILPRVPNARLMMITDSCPEHPAVDHLPYLTDNQVADTLAKSWIFAYPSTYEGFGIPYIEAMASGTAIITSHNPGAQEILANGDFGIIVTDEQFAQTLINTMQNGTIRRELESKGIERAKQFTADAVAQRYEEIYFNAMYRRDNMKRTAQK